MLGFAFALITNSSSLAQLTIFSRWIVGGGLIVLLVSVVVSTLVLLPRIKRGEPKAKELGILYFGHVRHWDKSRHSIVLSRNQVNDGEIADQMIKMSEISWRKHVLLQWSLYLLLTDIFVIGGLYLLFILGVCSGALGDLTVVENVNGGTACP